MAVEYFFIIAGFLLSYTFKNQSIIDFIKNKIIRLWPVLFFSVLLFLFADILGAIKHFETYANILSLLFLENVGVTLKWGNVGHDWFISVLFYVSIFYFYIFKNFDKKVYNFVILIMVLLGYTFLVHVTNGSIGEHLKTYNNIINVGLVHGLSAMGLGYLLHEMFIYFKSLKGNTTIKSIVVYSILEAYLLGFVVYESILHKMNFQNKIILVVAFCGLLLLFLLKKGFVSKILNNKFSNHIGKYSYSMFLTHRFVWVMMNYYLIKPNLEWVKLHPVATVTLLVINVIIFSIFTYHLVEVPGAKFLKKVFYQENTSK